MDDISIDVFAGARRLDVVETGRRRRWTDEAKFRIVEEAFQCGLPVLTVARRHDVDPSQICDWRKRLFPHVSKGAAGFAPVVVTPDVPVSLSRGQMEIVCGDLPPAGPAVITRVHRFDIRAASPAQARRV